MAELSSLVVPPCIKGDTIRDPESYISRRIRCTTQAPKQTKYKKTMPATPDGHCGHCPTDCAETKPAVSQYFIKGCPNR